MGIETGFVNVEEKDSLSRGFNSFFEGAGIENYESFTPPLVADSPLNKPSQPLVYALRDSLQYLLRPSTVSVEQGSSNLASCLFRRFNEGSRIISVNYVHFVFIVSSINLIISKINLYNFTLVKKFKNLNLEIKYWIY